MGGDFMIKVNRKLVLLLILVLIVSVLGGCGSKQEAPEGVDQEFYDDMVDCLKKLQKYRDDEDKNGSDIVQDYLENKIWLTSAEREIIEAIDDMYFEVWFYSIADDPNEHIVKNKIKKVAVLMDMELNMKKLLEKK